MFVRENMTKDPVCITPESTITQVVDLMSEKGLHRLPGGERQAHRRSGNGRRHLFQRCQQGDQPEHL